MNVVSINQLIGRGTDKEFFSVIDNFIIAHVLVLVLKHNYYFHGKVEKLLNQTFYYSEKKKAQIEF